MGLAWVFHQVTDGKPGSGRGLASLAAPRSCSLKVWVYCHDRDSPGGIHGALRPLGMAQKVGWMLLLPDLGQTAPGPQTLSLTASLNIALELYSVPGTYQNWCYPLGNRDVGSPKTLTPVSQC